MCVCVMVRYTAKHAYCSIVLFPIYCGEPIIQSTGISIKKVDIFSCKDCRRNVR